MQYEKEKYPNIAFTCEATDSALLSEPNMTDDEDNPQPVPGAEAYFWIGSHGERAAGLYPYAVTPTFTGFEDLETFCRENRAEYEKLAEADYCPRKLFWEQDKVPAETVAERKVRVALEHIAGAETRLLSAEDRFRNSGLTESKSSGIARARAELMPIREILNGPKT